MAGELQPTGGIEIRIGNVPVEAKLDALGAAILAVMEAHRDTLSKKSWAALNVARDQIAEAILHANDDARAAYLVEWAKWRGLEG